MNQRTGYRRIVVVGVVLVVALAGLVLHRLALAHVREMEEAFVEGRQVTACATAALAPFARGGRDIEELPDAVEGLVVGARADVAELARTVQGTGAPPYPRTSAATAAVRDAIRAQLALYEVLVDEPDQSDDELARLGVANRKAEARLGAARSVLFIGTPPGWSKRNTCADPPAG